jgi:K+-sensing histidine kinase KdpD
MLMLINITTPRLLVKSVSWDPHVQFYLGDFEFKLIPLVYTGMFFWFYGILKLLQTHRRSRSATERNRLKYLILGGSLPVLGMILISLPILAIRRYPLDMWGCTLGAICLAYGVLRYQLLDITIIIRKGLLYSFLTAAVTGIYLFFAFLLQHLLKPIAAPVSLPAASFTALIVALVFQPLQNTTQKIIDRFFFRRQYNPQEFVSHLSEICASTLDLPELTTSLVSFILQTLQIGKDGLFLVKRGSNRLQLAFQKGLEKDAAEIVFTTDRPLAQFLSQTDEVNLIYDLEDKKIPLEGLDEQGLKIFVPLNSRGKLRGVLTLGPKLSEEIYSLEEINLLQTVADSAALALENAQLFTEIKEEKERVEKLLADGK